MIVVCVINFTSWALEGTAISVGNDLSESYATHFKSQLPSCVKFKPLVQTSD